MFCYKCGKQIDDDASFCIHCGEPIPKDPVEPAATAAEATATAAAATAAPEAETAPEAAAPEAPAAAPAAQQAPKKESTILSFDQFFKTLFRAFAKPVTGVIEEKDRYEAFANSAILSVIVIIILTLLRTAVNSTIGFIVDPWIGIGYGILTFFLSLLMFAILTFGCAGVYYVAGTIVKENWSYSKLLSIAAMSVGVGFLIRSVIVPICNLFYGNLGNGLSMAGLVYMTLMLYEGINAETGLTGNKKVYVHAACLGVTFLLAFLF